MTLFIAAAIFAACVGLRRYLDRPERTDREFGNGRIRLTALWNEGAAFSLPLKRGWVVLLSILILPFVWLFRRRSPLGAGLALGGGLSNCGSVCAMDGSTIMSVFPSSPGYGAMSGIWRTSPLSSAARCWPCWTERNNFRIEKHRSVI